MIKPRSSCCSECLKTEFVVVRCSGLARKVGSMDKCSEILADVCLSCGHIEKMYAERVNQLKENEE